MSRTTETDRGGKEKEIVYCYKSKVGTVRVYVKTSLSPRASVTVCISKKAYEVLETIVFFCLSLYMCHGDS